MKRLLCSICVLTSVIMLLAGCGKAEVKIEEKDEQMLELRVGYMPNYGSLWAIVNAIDLGYMEEEGIKVNLIEFADGPTIIAAVENGSIDIGYIGQGAHRLCINGKAKIFALSHISNADMVIGGNGIQTIEQLRGKKVAYVSGTSSEDILINSLQKAGLTLNDIIAVDMDIESIVDAMLLGSAEAAAVWSPYSLEILDKVAGTKKLTDNMSFSGETVALSSWVTGSEFLKHHKNVLIGFTKALFKAMDYAATEHQEETAQLVANQISMHVDEVYQQRGDAQWLTGREVSQGVKEGVIEAYYELQKNAFIEAGTVDDNPKVTDYVILDIMEKAGKY